MVEGKKNCEHEMKSVRGSENVIGLQEDDQVERVKSS